MPYSQRSLVPAHLHIFLHPAFWETLFALTEAQYTKTVCLRKVHTKYEHRNKMNDHLNHCINDLNFRVVTVSIGSQIVQIS
jgi:hypothetical protein